VGAHSESSASQIAIAVVDRDGSFLIGQRPQGVPLAGLWEFPGGKIEAGETAEVAAVRECLEETGLQVEPLFQYSPQAHEYEHGCVALCFVACRLARGEQDIPSAPFRWVRREELRDYAFPAGNAAILDVLCGATAGAGSQAKT
jgi:mutator protein MutT